MDSAKDSRDRQRLRSAFRAIATVVIMTSSGCAGFRPFRQDDRPVFGTETVSKASSSATENTGDLYAERVGHSPSSSRLAAARRQSSTPKESNEVVQAASTESTRDPAPIISLLPPIAIPPASFVDRPPSEEPTQTAETLEPRDPPMPLASTMPSTSTALVPQRKPKSSVPAPTVGSLLEESRKRLNSLISYRVEMSHQERVNGRLNPAEDVVMYIRRNPKAVRLEWLDGTNKGREVLYSADANNGLMHVRMSNPLMPRIAIAPDSPLATTNSRHPITEAGLDTIVGNMELSYSLQQSGNPTRGEVVYAGLEQPDGLDKPCHKMVRVTPNQETWLVYLDPSSHLPRLVQGTSGKGELLERYVFGNATFDLPELASADAFNPDARWGPAKGFFGRLSRANDNADKVTETR